MKNLIMLAVLLTSVSGYSGVRCERECDGDQRSAVNFTQVNNAKDRLLDTAGGFADSKIAANALLASSGKSALGDLSTAEYYAHAALVGRVSIFTELMDCSCPSEYSNLLGLLQNSESVLMSVKGKLSGK